MSSSDLPKLSNDLNDDSKQPDPGSIDVNSSVPAAISNVSVPSEAADSDLIEKEWVERAKQIVDHTKNDPHEQQKALSRMKADYMKKRYNKDIKVSDE